MLKKILLLTASLFLLWYTPHMLKDMHSVRFDSWTMVLFFAWIINMMVTGVFAFAGFALPTQKLLPESYYTIHYPDLLKKVYNFLGVAHFRKFLLATFWKSKSQQKKYFDGKRSGMTNLDVQSQKSEFGHLLPFLILSGISIYMIIRINVSLGISTMVLNIIGNLYPIILQRHHRMRIQAIRERKARK